MSHKNNKNSKDNKKVNPKTKKELNKMKLETSNGVGYSSESRKLGKQNPRENKQRSKMQ
ncbi:small, acid-soluble spore protein, alpha/beta type [Clostridium sp. DL1XJH146]